MATVSDPEPYGTQPPNPKAGSPDEGPDGVAQQSRARYRRAVDQVHQLTHASIESLARLGYAVIITDASGKIDYITARAHSLLETSGAWISLRDNRLNFARKDHKRQFQEVAGCVGNYQPGQDLPSRTFLLERDPCRKAISVSVFPLQPVEPDDAPITHIMIALYDPEHQPEQRWHQFRERFGLTAAELCLCRALADGLCTSQCAEKHGVSVNTVRTHLKSIFAKTGVQRQTDLLLLIFAAVRA